MNFIKKNWIAITLFVLIIILLIALLISNHKATNRDEAIAKYKTTIDSLIAVQKVSRELYSKDSLEHKKIVAQKDEEIKKKEAGIVYLNKIRKIELNKIDSLNAQHSVDLLSEKITKMTGVPTKLIPVVINSDTGVFLTVSHIRIVNHMIVDGEYSKQETDSLKALIVPLKMKIEEYIKFSNLQDEQIINLRRDIDKCLLVSSGENDLLVKLNKKIKNRNTWMGILGGAAIVGIGVAILK